MPRTRTDGAFPTAAYAVPPYRTGGVGKFVADTVSVFEINFLPVVRYWYITVLLAAGFAIPWFYVTRSIAPDDPDVVRRLLAGTLVFGVTFSIGTLVGNNAVAQRFMGNLRLLITMPVSKGAYVLGSLAFSSISGTITVVALLVFGLVAGVDIDVAWGLAPCLVLSVLTMAGLALFVVSFAPSLPAGNLITSLLSLALAAVSPVYFTMEAGAVAAQAARLRVAAQVRRRWDRQVRLRTRRRLDGADGAGRLRHRHYGPRALALAVAGDLAGGVTPPWRGGSRSRSPCPPGSRAGCTASRSPSPAPASPEAPPQACALPRHPPPSGRGAASLRPAL